MMVGGWRRVFQAREARHDGWWWLCGAGGKSLGLDQVSWGVVGGVGGPPVLVREGLSGGAAR